MSQGISRESTIANLTKIYLFPSNDKCNKQLVYFGNEILYSLNKQIVIVTNFDAKISLIIEKSTLAWLFY